MRKFGLIGYPLSHSFSPAFFADKFSREGLADCSYDLYPIEKIDNFPQLLLDHAGLEGINVTIPYKQSIIPFLNFTSEAVDKIAACNCIRIRNQQLTGYNTDVIGFELSLRPKLRPAHTHALILGTGGSAAAVAYVLSKLSINFLYVSRSSPSGSTSITYDQLTPDIITRHTLIINTTPLGMFPAINKCPRIPYDYLTTDHYLFDLVYNPAETVFLQRGAEKGATIKNGADMLVIQAEESWKIWNEPG